MSTPSIVRKTDTATLPPYTLAQFDVEQFAQAEEEFANLHRASVARFIISQPLGMAERFIDAAERLIAENHFRYGGFAFDAKARSVTTIPTLLWLCLSIKHHGEVSRDKARELYTAHPDKPELQRALLTLMGYDVPRKNVPAGTTGAVAGPSSEPAQGQSQGPTPGSSSPSTSASMDSATATSAG